MKQRKKKPGPRGPRGKPNPGSVTDYIVTAATTSVDPPATVDDLIARAASLSGKPVTRSLIYKARRFMPSDVLKRIFGQTTKAKA